MTNGELNSIVSQWPNRTFCPNLCVTFNLKSYLSFEWAPKWGLSDGVIFKMQISVSRALELQVGAGAHSRCSLLVLNAGGKYQSFGFWKSRKAGIVAHERAHLEKRLLEKRHSLPMRLSAKVPDARLNTHSAPLPERQDTDGANDKAASFGLFWTKSGPGVIYIS